MCVDKTGTLTRSIIKTSCFRYLDTYLGSQCCWYDVSLEVASSSLILYAVDVTRSVSFRVLVIHLKTGNAGGFVTLPILFSLCVLYFPLVYFFLFSSNA